MVDNELLVSVIIPAYNAEKWIRRSIESVLNQDYPTLEIIVVDDVSTDNTSKIVKEYANRVKYILQEKNMGPGSARNRGALEAQGEYLMFLDADDEYCIGIIEKMVNGFNLIPNMDAGMFGYIKKEKAAETMYPSNFKEKKYTQVKDFFLIKSDCGIPWTGSFICKRKVFNDIGGYITTISRGEDKEFFMRLGGKYNWFLAPEYGVIYHFSWDNTTTQTKPIDPIKRISALIYSQSEIDKWINPELRRSFNAYQQKLIKSTIIMSKNNVDNYYTFYKVLRSRTKISPLNKLYLVATWLKEKIN